LQEWADAWPESRLYAPPGLASRNKKLTFSEELRDCAEPAWHEVIDQVIFHGSFVMEEVVFFHRPSSTAIFGDLIQRQYESTTKGFLGFLLRLDGMGGKTGSTPREWRATFLQRKKARQALTRVLEWQPDRLLIAHGENAHSGASDIIKNALKWI
jgi:hypothetical protein